MTQFYVTPGQGSLVRSKPIKHWSRRGELPTRPDREAVLERILDGTT